MLLVDDDPLVCAGTTAMLEDLGHEVTEADSGLDALKILEAANAIELVITDQNMPGMTGLQLARQIRKQWPDIHVVLATGYAELPRGEEEQFQKLAKPYTQAALSAMIADATDKIVSPVTAHKKA